MLFEKEQYYKYINQIEKSITITYIIIIGLFTIFGLIIGKLLGLIIGILIGIFLSSTYTLGAKIKIQKMRWEIDIYDKIHSIKNEEK